MRQGWESDNPTFRQVFTSRFIPGGTEDQMHWFNELCRRTTDADTAARVLADRANVDVSPLLARVRAPTLVLHARGDEAVPIQEGREIAAGIPNADFVELNARNHVLLENEPAWQDFQEHVLHFLGMAGDTDVFALLTRRERELLALLTEGLSNIQIADRLHISEKTVRNQLSGLFAKLGVHTRTRAIALARDHGFPG
jgi:DNA-binding NarL/FixJ family response regulator